MLVFVGMDLGDTHIKKILIFMNNLINWSAVSRLLTSDRTAIRSDYNGKKYKRKIDRLKRMVELWVRWQNGL